MLVEDFTMERFPDLKKVETRVFRNLFLEDGLLDVFLGLMLLPYTFWIFRPDSFLSGALSPPIVFILVYPLYMVFRKRVVLPRVGMIKPGPVRRRRMKILLPVTGTAVVVTIGLVLFTVLKGAAAVRPVAGIPLVFWILGGAIFWGTLITAWVANCPRFILYGILAAVAIPGDAIFSLRSGRVPLTTLPIIVMTGFGIYLLIRFLRSHPLPTSEGLQ